MKKSLLLTKGFTLIELLVVIAIIGLLASVVLVSFNTSTSKSRDSSRMQELKQIQMALRLYYDVYHEMPDNQETAGTYCDDKPNFLQELVDKGFFPHNPKSENGSKYCYWNYGANDSDGAGALLGFELETESYKGPGLEGTCRPFGSGWCAADDNQWYCLCTPYSPY